MAWPGATFVCRIERLREGADRCSRQVVYAITSLAPERAGSEALLALARNHWAIENRHHWVLDVVFGEDACRVRSANAPANLSRLRHTAMAIIRARGMKPKAAREGFAANHKAAIRAVLAS